MYLLKHRYGELLYTENITDGWSHLERVTVVYPDDMSFGRETLWLSQPGLGRNCLVSYMQMKRPDTCNEKRQALVFM